MGTIMEKDKVYISDGDSFAVSEFDIEDEGLVYTMDFNTKGMYSIFFNMYNRQKNKPVWEINIDQDHLFYHSLAELIEGNKQLSFTDRRFDDRHATFIQNEDGTITVQIACPNTMFDMVNIRLREDDPNLYRFDNLLWSLDRLFKEYKPDPKAK